MTTNKYGFDVSGIQFPLERWRYLILFQSLPQAISWCLIVLACMVFILNVISSSGRGDVPTLGIMVGGVAGASFSLMSVFRSQFTVRKGGDRALTEIESRLMGISYVEQDRILDKLIYRQNLPRLLRWDEGNVEIVVNGKDVVVSGPYISLRKIHSQL